MPPVFRFMVVAALTCCLSGCAKDIETPPIVSASAYLEQPPGASRPARLNQERIAHLSRWVEAHRAGWHGLMETPPWPAFSFGVAYADGRTGSFEVFVSPRGDGTVYHYVYGRERVLPLRRELSAEDVRTLRTMAGIAEPLK